MAFPANPTNGQTTVQNNITYSYNSTKDTWTKLSSISSATTLTVTGNANVGNLGTGGLIVATGNITGGNLTTTGTANVGTLISTTTTSLSSSLTGALRGLNVYSSEISWQNTSGSTVYFNISDNVGSNGSTMSLYIRGLNTAGSATGTLAGITMQAANTTFVGNILPSANATYNIGSATNRWSVVYTTDLELSNGIGDYTIVEGEDDLFLYNNKRGKVYKFALIEVDPKDAPPKAGGK